jgi:phosphopantothenoylcysteine decarboxylase/phosphopantothenate--cysteine ligase
MMELKPNRDILKELGMNIDKERQVLVGFAAESSNIKEEGMRKLKEKNLDLIAVNDITGKQSGFGVDSNQLLLIDKDKETLLPHTSKEKTADMLWDYVVNEKL